MHVKVQPKSSNNQICGLENNALKIKVTSPADKSLANKAVIELLSKELNIAKSTILLIKGAKSNHKTFCFLSEPLESLIEKLKRFNAPH
ncbi:MAG: DUF167 domain-containing protein [Chlamydiota bacterium]